MQILITGASGLIGTALARQLLAEGHIVFCQSRSVHANEPGVTWIRHDLTTDPYDKLLLPPVDIVYHLAGQTSTYVARQDPVRDLSINVVGFLNLLQALRTQDALPFIVLAGTATQVGLSDQLPINEKFPDRPITFYDLSKLTAEMYLKQYVREGWVRGCCLRLANVFGRHQPGQQADRGIIDKIFRRALSGQPITIYGDGDYLRDYVFIDDVVSAFIAASICPENTNGRSFYIGTGVGITLNDAFLRVSALAARFTGVQVQHNHVKAPSGLSAIEFRNAIVDPTAFGAATGWRPQYDFDAGLQAAYRDFVVGRASE